MPIALPEVTASLRAAGVTQGLAPEQLLIVGQKVGGTATSGALIENIFSDGAEDGLFGEDSPLAAAVRRARRRNEETKISAIGVDDNAGGVAATGTITVTGAATEGGTINFYVGSQKFNEYTIPAVSGDSADSIGAALETAINADTKAFVTASNTSGVVTLTAKTKGLFGNSLGIKIADSVGGLTTAAAAMAGGATDPVLTGILDVVGDERYQGIVWQWAEDTDEVVDFLDARFNVSNNVLDGRAFVSKTDTYANHLTALGSLNSSSLCYNTDKLIDTDLQQGPAILEVPFVKVAEFGAIRALRRSDEAALGSLVIARNPRDSFGGAWQNSKPYFNTPFPDCEVPNPGQSFTDVEIGFLKDAGGWVIDTNRPYAQVISGEVVTTYLTDAAGNPDPTFGFLNYVDTSTAAREYIVNNTRSKYPQYRATSGALINGVDSANEASIAAYVAELYADMGDLALVNTGVGSIDGQAVDFDKLFREGLAVTLNPVTGKFFVSCKLYIVVQLRGVIYDLAIAFEV